eukprot:Skav210917  [mRNA]  locus=scaffold4127:40486:41746:+ [translate_table: standard]
MSRLFRHASSIELPSPVSDGEDELMQGSVTMRSHDCELNDAVALPSDVESDIDMPTPRQDIKKCLKFSPKISPSSSSLLHRKPTHHPAMPVHSKPASQQARRAKQLIKGGKVKNKVIKGGNVKNKVKVHALPAPPEVIQQDSVCMEVAKRELKKWLCNHDIMEFYSPPRLCPRAGEFGMVGVISLDKVHGWDALNPNHRRIARQLLVHLKPSFLMLGPPCTFFSPLMHMWNFKKMSPKMIAARRKEAHAMVSQAVDSCKEQHDSERFFVFEHPNRASSWRTTKLKQAIRWPGTYTVDFDQCSLGLVSPLGQPMKKRTRLFTNSRVVVKRFAHCQCRCETEHRRIQGSECGVQLSKHAQCYPPNMVRLLLQCAKEEGA